MKLFISSLIFFSFLNDSSAARPIRGTYEVPTSDELKPFSSFNVKFKSDEYDRNPVAISFPLPSELTGQENTVTMKQSSSDSSVWAGPNVNASCSKEGRYFVCHMQFNDLDIDLVKAEELVLARNPNPATAASIFEVVKKFSGEGIGILKYKLRGRDRE